MRLLGRTASGWAGSGPIMASDYYQARCPGTQDDVDRAKFQGFGTYKLPTEERVHEIMEAT